MLPLECDFKPKFTNDFSNLWRKSITAWIFNFYPLNALFRQNLLQRLQSWGPDASLDTHIDSLDQLCCLWQLWPYSHYGHYGNMVIVHRPLNSLFRQNQLQRLQSWGPDASLDTHIDSLDQLWRLWRLWPYGQYGHYGDMAIVAIDTIVDQGHQYGCLMKHLDLRIAASDADFD